MLTQFESNPGWASFPIFYEAEISSEKRIPYGFDIDDIPFDSIYAFGGVAGVAYGGDRLHKAIRYIEYFVGNQVQIREAIKQLDEFDVYQLVDSLNSE